jgi:hypothetical protein
MKSRKSAFSSSSSSFSSSSWKDRKYRKEETEFLVQKDASKS